MNTVTKQQLTAIHTLLHKCGKMAYKIDLVHEFTNGRESSTRGLTHDEAKRMITYLKDGMEKHERDKADRMRKKIISHLRQCGYTIGPRADMAKIYAWVEKYGYLKKTLNQYSAAELPKLVSQAQQYLKSTLAAYAKTEKTERK
jgi:hypothetical protein